MCLSHQCRLEPATEDWKHYHSPPELAVRHALDANLALHFYNLRDSGILDYLELLRRTFAGVELCALVQQRLGPLERANVVRAERGVEFANRSRHGGECVLNLRILRTVAAGESVLIWMPGARTTAAD